MGVEACIPAGPAGAIQPSGGCRITSTSDSLEFACDPGETILEAALRAGIPFAHACGGNARCSTCRIWLANDPAELPSPNAAEAALKERLALGSEIRLACQLRPTGAVNFRRLVLDESDLRIANQLDRRHPMQSGEIRNVAVLFFDVAGFTSIAKRMPPHDVMFLLNKFLAQVNKVLEKYGGYFDKTIGDGFVAIFGVKGAEACALRAVAAAIEILDTVERARPIVRQLYDVEFYGRMGLHYGEALIGALGPPGEERLTVIGDVANMASRVEQANKDAGTSLLVTQELYEEVRDDVVSPDFLRVAIRGHTERKTLHEVTGLKPAARERVETLATLPVSDLPQRRWERLLELGNAAGRRRPDRAADASGCRPDPARRARLCLQQPLSARKASLFRGGDSGRRADAANSGRKPGHRQHAHFLSLP